MKGRSFFMNISPVSNLIVSPKYGNKFTSGVSPDFQASEKKKKAAPRKTENLQDGKYSTKQVAGITLAAALSAAALGGAVMHGRSRHLINSLNSDKHSLQRLNSELQNTVDDGVRRIKNLSDEVGLLDRANKILDSDNKELRKLNKALNDEVQKAKDKFTDIFEGDLAPKDVRDKIYARLKTKVEDGNLGYDISKPPVTGKSEAPVYTDAVDFPTYVGTSNRANMRSLDIPNISENGSFEFRLPTSPEVKITHMETKNFKPVYNQLTNITESYSDSVQWNNDKIARDVLQNFFDGHGQTLDGVQMSFTPAGNGNFKVKIQGNSTYTADKAVYIGESTKRGDAKAAGNYGEGLKMSVLKLLKDKGANDVKIGSDNWKLTYSLANSDLSDKRVMAYSLEKVNPQNGNYIEFETSDRGLLETFRKSINRFYHSGNEHFKCPKFENDIIGIKVLGPNEPGGVYIAGQRFEYDNNYDGLKGFTLFLKEKPPISVLDPSRDRTSLNQSNIEDIAKWLARESRMSNDDKLKLLKSLESCWDKKSFMSEGPMDNFVKRFLSYINWDSDRKPLHVKFPSNYVAYSGATNDVVNNLRLNGYKVCQEGFEKLGMQTIKNLMGDARAHEVVMPNEVQTKKIKILKEALQCLSGSLKNSHFTADELDAKIYLFDNKGVKDSKLYKSALAEAITDNGVSKGFWLDKAYLDRTSLSDVLETALHELSHKVGGDESAEFSYKLTNVNSEAISHILNNIESRNELQALNRLWNEAA